jgi:hypothetical protein
MEVAVGGVQLGRKLEHDLCSWVWSSLYFYCHLERRFIPITAKLLGSLNYFAMFELQKIMMNSSRRMSVMRVLSQIQ